MRKGETLKMYSDRYWEMFNEIYGTFDDVAIRTFKVSLPIEHDLKKSLTRKLAKSVHQLMDQIDECKRVEKDQQQGNRKDKIIPQDWRDFQSNRYNRNRSWRDFVGHTRAATTQVISNVFREPVHQILERIKNEPYFKWPNKMEGDPTKHNQSFHC